MAKSLSELLEEIRDDIDEELKSTPDVVEKSADTFDVDKLPINKREWHKLDDVVAVAVDLKGSSKMSTGKHAASTASIYEASTDNAVRVLHHFGADFIQIQGDGAFGLFWGERRYERAMCAAITVKTFSEHLTAKIEAKWPYAPATGYKVGVASGRVLAKRIGTPRNPAEQEPIWSGKPVNYAVKAAQAAEAGELIVTGDVWVEIENNDYFVASCGHAGDDVGEVAELWENVTIEHVPDDAQEGRVLRSVWCSYCGDEFCDAVLAGKTTRHDATAVSENARTSALRSGLAKVRAKRRKRYEDRVRGLAR
ncbi:hypothetical protein BOH66_06210 [Microbacterium aurum]|uniref:Guanylate cyclase domain-containing protein n=1 Tax=Microbacterium aurum TaxID=36805 RepID=A0A1P8U703_9MICO|nr:hypothetical protein [Microbacterium aurum]APZ33892.1 hypothetical protein BOH66_06210 [Microbacterium aurum]MBM7827653.1 class 3 adenylate cyclase [Microbacterium aurum]